MGKLIIINKPEISAIYYALLQCGYDFYIFDKDSDLIKNIKGFYKKECDLDTTFFKKVKQDTCEVYPYWPRAFTLEKATFYLCKNTWRFRDFDSYKQNILNLKNISDSEKNEDFWEWIKEFPNVLKKVMKSIDFKTYLKWEDFILL